MYRKRNFKDFKIKKLGEYHDLHVQSDSFLVTDVLENFRNMSPVIYEIDTARFLTTPGLPWGAVE